MKKLIICLFSLMLLGCNNTNNSNNLSTDFESGLYLGSYVSSITNVPEINIDLKYREVSDTIFNYKVLKLYQNDNIIKSYKLKYSWSSLYYGKNIIYNEYEYIIKDIKDLEYLTAVLTNDNIKYYICDSIKEYKINSKEIKKLRINFIKWYNFKNKNKINKISEY